MMILDPKSTFSETIPKFLEIEKFMKILKISKSQCKWALFQWLFEISKKNSSFSFEIPNKSRNTYKTNEKSTFFQNESFLGKNSKSQGKWGLFQWIFEISKKKSSFSFEIPNKSKNTYKTNEKSTFFQNESFLGKKSKTQEKWRAHYYRKIQKNHESIPTFS